MIGTTVWIFDINRRVYAKPAPGRIYAEGGPIWKKHWAPRTIKTETSRSWVLDNGAKIAKKGPWVNGVAWSEEEIDKLAWVHDHAYKIGERVGRLRDPDILRRVAEAIGYAEADAEAMRK